MLGKRTFVTPVRKGEDDGGGGGDDSDEAREDFNPVAVWVGALQTDATGSAVHEQRVP